MADPNTQAALNPTAVNITIPTSGLFRAVGDNGDAVYSFDANGVPTAYALHTGSGPANDYGANFANLKQYGIDFNSLPTFNKADIDQRLLSQGRIGSNGMPIYNNGGTLADLANLKGVPVSTMTQTLNGTPNQLGTPTNANPATALPNNGGAAPSTATVSPAASQPLSVAGGGQVAQPIDYTLHPGESIAQYNARIAAANPNLPAPGTTSSTGVTNTATPAPSLTQIPSTLTPPSNVGTFTPPNAQAPGVLDTFHTSLAAQLATTQQNLQQAYQTQAQNYQQQIDAQKQQESQALDLFGLANTQDIQQKQQALAQEQQQFNDAYNAKQSLIGEMNGLLTQGNQIISDMKATTGLSSIMNPRISQTMADVTARAGVINTMLNAYDGQIGVAQSQLSATLNALTSIYGDQKSYYQSIIDAADSKIVSLSKDQKTYIDASISQLETQAKTAQDTANIIQSAMVDPNKALAFAQAGVSLNDSPAQIAQKLATYQQAQDIKSTNDAMVKAGYSTAPIAGAKQEAVTDAYGKVWYKSISSTQSAGGGAGGGGTGGGSSSGAYPKGSMSNKQYVNLALTRLGLDYNKVISQIPAGKMGVVDNATGQVGYIEPTEYNTHTYTQL